MGPNMPEPVTPERYKRNKDLLKVFESQAVECLKQNDIPKALDFIHEAEAQALMYHDVVRLHLWYRDVSECNPI